MTTARSASQNSSTTGTAISVSAPAGVQVGDVVIITIHVNGNTTIVDNNGSTPFTEDLHDYQPNPSSGHTFAIFSRRIQSGDPATYNFTSGASGRWSISACAWQNPHSTDIYDVAPNTSNAAAATDAVSEISAPSITTNTNNAIHVVCAGWDTGNLGSITEPSGYTNINEVASQPQGSSYKVIATAGATGAQQYESTEDNPRFAISFAIKDDGYSVTQKTTTGKSRIRVSILKTLLGKSRITSTISLVDSYSENNAIASNPYILDGNITAVGQSFTGKGTLLNHAVFYVKKVGSPTGNAVAKIYAHTGVFGSEGMPTGSPLATSDNFDVSTLTTSYGLISFNFTGANKILLANGINYVVTLEYSNGSGSNYLLAGMDNTSPSHSGNMSFKEIGNWGYDNYDLSFYVYGYTAGLLLGKSRISTSVSAIISAVSRIRVSAVKTALGKARVRAVNLTTFIGKSKITAIGAFRRNLCTNPSFETNNTGFWSGSTSRSNDYALYGSYSGKITTTFTNGTITGGHNYLNTQNQNRFSAIAGRKYIFSAYIYVPVGSPITTISIGIRSWNTYAYRSVNGTKTLTPGQWVRVSVDWLCTSQEDLRFTVADPAAPGFTGSASLYVDGIAIEEIVPGNNLAPNSSFELDTDWSTNINFSYSTEQKYIGNRSMKFNSLTPTANASITGYIGVKSSTLYLLSCMMYRVAGFSGAIYIDFFEYDKNFNLLNDATGVYFSGSNSIWVKKETIFTTNANTKYIKLRLVCDSSALGTAYFDDVFLYPLDYFDGSISPATWLGVAHGSISILLISGILGLSRITIASLQTLLGKSRIMITVLKTVLGKSRMTAVRMEYVAGRARITIIIQSTLTGIGRVQKAIIKTISGKGSINALTSKELTGKARIISPGRYIRQVSQSTSQGKLYNPAGQDFYTQL